MIVPLCVHLLIGGAHPLGTPIDVMWKDFCAKHIIADAPECVEREEAEAIRRAFEESLTPEQREQIRKRAEEVEHEPKG